MGNYSTMAIELIMGRKPESKEIRNADEIKIDDCYHKVVNFNETRTLFAFHKSGKLLTLGLANGAHAVSNFIKTPHGLSLSLSAFAPRSVVLSLCACRFFLLPELPLLL